MANDEFYTQIGDIESELKHYRDQFRGKVILLNCDDPEHSAFWKYFEVNFKELGVKKVIATHHDKEHPTYKMEMTGPNECIELLKESDMVVTNLLVCSRRIGYGLARLFIQGIENFGYRIIMS